MKEWISTFILIIISQVIIIAIEYLGREQLIPGWSIIPVLLITDIILAGIISTFKTNNE